MTDQKGITLYHDPQQWAFNQVKEAMEEDDRYPDDLSDGDCVKEMSEDWLGFDFDNFDPDS